MDLFSILLPIFLIFGVGYVGQRTIGFDTKQLSTMALYLMSPFLAFRTFYLNPLTIEHLYMMVYTFSLCLSLLAVVWLYSKYRKWTASQMSGMMLASAFMNNGNYGTPLAILLWGTVGLDYAVILMVLQQIVMSTLGLYLAAKGSEKEGVNLSMALRAVVRMPILYGALTGVVLQYIGLHLSASLMQAVHFIADAAVPTIMIILGMQLATISLKKIPKEMMVISLLIKLCLSPLIALGIAILLPIDEMLLMIMVVMAAMPSAANTTMYAVQFETEAEFVSGATFVSTLLSLVTLPVIMWLVLS